jgi:Asp-tRNA(Asn)/Glu-tRNA(Gln) amidotransferase A subunit family amidase
MPIKIEISGESMGDIELALQALNRPDPRTMPLTDLWEIAQDRFADGGFVLTAVAPSDVAGTPAPGSVAAVEKALKENAAEEALVEDTALPPKRKKTTAAKKPAPEAVPAAADNGDRAYVLDELTKRFADPKQKTQAKAFIDKVAGRHGGVRLSRLEPELFPQIREEMVVEFGLAGSNGHAGI